jgi:hypothetical protein
MVAIINFYEMGNETRDAEFRFFLKKNIDNPAVTKIYGSSKFKYYYNEVIDYNAEHPRGCLFIIPPDVRKNLFSPDSSIKGGTKQKRQQASTKENAMST